MTDFALKHLCPWCLRDRLLALAMQFMVWSIKLHYGFHKRLERR